METKSIKNFDDLKTMGCVRKSFKVGEHTIAMRSLGYEEQSQIVANVPDGVKDSRKFDIIQKEMLAASIETIDGQTFSIEEKNSLLGDSQTAFVNLLFAQYEQLLTVQNQIIDGVKKNISSLETTH
jgi:hypothetical protein